MELLAPAGSFDVFKIAVNTGSDAVYLSGKRFGARAFAENFTMEEIEKSVKYAHLNNVKVFITINTLINNFEIIDFLKYVFKLYKIGVDAVIVQDFGALKLIRTIFPDIKIHASTQMGLNNYYSALWASKNGISRVIFPRELSLDEISIIGSKLKENGINLELEVFAHGAICYSISGNCYISSLNTGRSGNRGACTQPCRREYILKYKGYNIDNGYLLSTHDLNTAENLDKISKAGIDSIKLEGRMKSEDYVGTIVNSYRNILDKKKKEFKDDLNLVFNRKFTKGYLLGEKPGDVMGRESSGHTGFYIGDIINISNEEEFIVNDKNKFKSNSNSNSNKNNSISNKNNSNSKNSNFNKSNYKNNFNNSNFNKNNSNFNKSNYKNNSNKNNSNKNNFNNSNSNKSNSNKKSNKIKNNYTDESIYRVKEIKVNKKNHVDIKIGDGIAFKYNDKIKGIYIDNIIEQNDDYIVFNTTRNVRVGDKVFISYSHLLHKELKKYKKEYIQPKIPLSLNISLNKYLEIFMKAEFKLNSDKIKFNYSSPTSFQKAINRPTSIKEIEKQLHKTGNTPFFMEKIEISNFSNDLFIPTSQLNNLRREILDEASKHLLKYYKPNKKEIDSVNYRLNSFIKNYKSKELENPKSKELENSKTLELAVIVDNLSLVKIASRYHMKKIYFDPSYLYNTSTDYFNSIEKLLLEAVIEIGINNPNKTLEIVWVLPSFISDDEVEKSIEIFNNLKNEGIELSIMTDTPGLNNLFDCKVYGTYNLNLWNSYSCENLRDSGFNSLILSPELSYSEIEELNLKYSDDDTDLELMVHGNLEVIVSYDDFSSLNNGKDLITNNDSDYAILEDKKRKKFKYRVHFDFNKKSHIINKDCLCLIDELDKIKRLGLNFIVLDCKFSNKSYMSQIISLYLDGMKNPDKKRLNSIKKKVLSISHSYLNKDNFLYGRIHEKD
ncbi:MAG: DUF3656 domain-containing protein [Methanobrevibacter sp.]|jgi:putative protease|nr:DUF3656 domain-containing protein [Candidatus Methanovirga meridionalis]